MNKPQPTAPLQADTKTDGDYVRYIADVFRREEKWYQIRRTVVKYAVFTALNLYFYQYLAWRGTSIGAVIGCMCLMLVSGIASRIIVYRTKTHRRTFKAAVDAHDERIAWPLIEALYHPFKRISPQIKTALIEILPRLDQDMILRRHREILENQLDTPLGNVDFEFRIAVVDALERVGNAETAKRLRGILTHQWVCRNIHIERRVQEAIATIEKRTVYEAESRKLLRPASPPTDETLLRPAANAPAADAALLVRPAEAPATQEANRE